MDTRTCKHGRIWPCHQCIGRARLADLARGVLYTVACIVLCAAVAFAWIGIASPACGQGYCGTCDLNNRCPGGCACDTSSGACVDVP